MSDTAETAIALAVLPAGFDVQGHPRFWLERRPETAHLGGMLAFPGGKCATHEVPVDALHRELHEELGIEPINPQFMMSIPWVYPAEPPLKPLRLWVYRIEQWFGKLHGREGQRVMPVTLDCSRPTEWFNALPPANRGVVAALCLPPRFVITAACDAGPEGFDRWLHAVSKTARGLRTRFGPRSAMMLLRPNQNLERSQWETAVRLVRNERLIAFVNADLAVAKAAGAEGVHLNRARMAVIPADELARWQADNHWVSATGHSVAEVALANALGVNALLISPVLPTPSHPGELGMGWGEFTELTRHATMPCYALGGMNEDFLPHAQSMGAQGIAAIRGYWLSRI